MTRVATLFSALLTLACLSGPAAAQRLQASATCEATDDDLVYLCQFDITRSGEALTGAAFTITPTMPAMPMAHNIPPVAAEEPCTAGRGYHAYLTLDMHGDWALVLDFTAPQRDRIVLNHSFLPPDGEDAAETHGAHRH
jgi:hypothetical protein